jgi:hypothetical protein
VQQLQARANNFKLQPLTRAQIRPPLDGEIISPKTTRHSNTTDDVKANIDNVNAKIQNKEERRP